MVNADVIGLIKKELKVHKKLYLYVFTSMPPLRDNFNKVDVPVDGKFLREALFKKICFYNKHNTNFSSCYGFQDTFFSFNFSHLRHQLYLYF